MKIVQGKNINLRTAEIEDAAFILELRMLEHKNKHLSKVENDLQKQQEWLTAYKLKELDGQEYYFVIENKKGENLGLVRVYDLQPESFCWGSWLIKDGVPMNTAVESALQVYEFGFGDLAYEKAHFDVRKGNKKVIDFHLRFGAKITSEDEMNVYFNYEKERHERTKQKYKRYIN